MNSEVENFAILLHINRINKLLAFVILETRKVVLNSTVGAIKESACDHAGIPTQCHDMNGHMKGKKGRSGHRALNQNNK